VEFAGGSAKLCPGSDNAKMVEVGSCKRVEYKRSEYGAQSGGIKGDRMRPNTGSISYVIFKPQLE
jgi:hypothetical protein